MDPIFFEDGDAFSRWLEAHHDSERELLVGFHKLDSGRQGITYPQALDAALCWGWIDGVRRSLGDGRWTIRFTPRKPRSSWSRVNIAKAEELIRRRVMRPPGLAAFRTRTEDRSEIHSYEQADQALAGAELEALRTNPAAWAFFSAQPPGYRRIATWWVVSAKKPETRARRLAQLVDCSARGLPLPQMGRSPKPPGSSAPRG